MIQWTKVEEQMPQPLEKFQNYSFLTDRFQFRPLLFIGLVQYKNSHDKYRSYFGRYNHDGKMWVNMEGEQIYGVTQWTEYNEPEDL